MKFSTVFSEKTGSAKNYRIPSMLVAKNGALVAVADERFFTGGDNPNRIDKVCRISYDNGATWGEQKTVVKEVGEDKMHASASIDAALLCNDSNGDIFMLCSHTPAGVGILNCKKSIGEYKGYPIVRKGNKLYYIKDTEIISKAGVATGYTVDKEGYIFKNGENKGNIKVGDGEFIEEKTAYLTLSKSSDNGETWGDAVCVNNMVKKPNWGFIGAGPGVGICIKHGKYAGRLVFPFYFGSHKIPSCNALAMFSDDNGVTWQRGKPYKDDYRECILNFARWLDYSLWKTESQIIERDDGTLMAFIRNHNAKRRIATAISKDGGATWQDYHHRSELPHPICQISAIKFKYNGKSCVVTLNAADTKKRQNGVIRLSEDDGATFQYSRQLVAGEFVYSSMAMLPDGQIAILFEGETSHTKIDFVKISVEWIKGREE